MAIIKVLVLEFMSFRININISNYLQESMCFTKKDALKILMIMIQFVYNSEIQLINSQKSVLTMTKIL